MATATPLKPYGSALQPPRGMGVQKDAKLRSGGAIRIKATPSSQPLAQGLQVFRPAAFADCKKLCQPKPGAKLQLVDVIDTQDEGFDGEEPRLCPECGLPIGDGGYTDEASGDVVHGECRAQLILNELRREEDGRQREQSAVKQQRRAEYGIGWEASKIPSGIALAGKLQLDPAPRGMCCLVLEEEPRKLRVVPTLDPAASMNLEYLSVALQVRKREGREPLFSLDPEDDFFSRSLCLDEDAKNPLESMKDLVQIKRFEPEWLVRTSAGEVMFQADYHLKELAMGECQQPVVGMKSCFDVPAADGGEEWRAREWFVVRKAEVLLADGNVLIPRAEMGVEAREQVSGKGGIEDAPITRPDHPLVQYANAFTHFFDLIAERKSVVYHLRELARASVLAKFLMDGEVPLEDAWFGPAPEAGGGCGLEVPQLWNERAFSEIHVRDGTIVHPDDSICPNVRGVYGGVEFGLERAGIPAVPRVTARIPSTGVAATSQFPALAKRAMEKMQPLALAGLPAGAVPALSRAAPMLSIGAGPKGVDLDLGRFDLSAANRAQPSPAGCPAHEGGLPLAALGDAFWPSLDSESESVFSGKDRALLKSVFNPCISDRRDEGDRFVPPSTDAEYLQKLESLVAEEQGVQQRRRAHFLSKQFAAESAGPLFPASWTSSFGIARAEAGQAPSAGASRVGRSPCKEEAAKLEQAVRTAAPTFDRSTEDGTRFRIYVVGGLEVRTIQEHGGKELIGQIFSARAHGLVGGEVGGVKDADCIVKATEYVESAGHRSPAARPTKLQCHYYVVLETRAGGEVVTERLATGAVAWVENPKDLEARNMMAKVTGCIDCSNEKITVRDVRTVHAEEAYCVLPSATLLERRRYAQRVFGLALPASQKCWGALTEPQARAAGQLGVCTAEEWDAGAAEVFRSPWWDLSEPQRQAAGALGMDADSWGKLVKRSQGPCETRWGDLTAVEREEAKEAGIASAEAWTAASSDDKDLVLATLWARGWAQLTGTEQRAAGELGAGGEDDWDEASWKSGGVWGLRWAQLTDEQKEAARQLGVGSKGLWSKASRDKLDRHWAVTPWADLSTGQKAAAGRLGYSQASWFCKPREA